MKFARHLHGLKRPFGFAELTIANPDSRFPSHTALLAATRHIQFSLTHPFECALKACYNAPGGVSLPDLVRLDRNAVLFSHLPLLELDHRRKASNSAHRIESAISPSTVKALPKLPGICSHFIIVSPLTSHITTCF